MTYRNRIVDMQNVRAGDLLDHNGNPFVHPQFQSEATQGSLEDIGIVMPLAAYYSERNGGKLTLLDGHDRKSYNRDQLWPVAILDLNDEEADKQIMVHNLVSTWVGINPLKMQELVEKARTENEKLKAAAARLAEQIKDQVAIARQLAGDESAQRPGRQFKHSLAGSAVKVVVEVGDGLMAVEQAIKTTGKKRRGDALVEICRYYLENHADD